MTCVSRVSDSRHIPHFYPFILSNNFLWNFLLVFCFGWQHLHSRFLLASYLLMLETDRADLHLYFQIKQVFYFLVETLSFGFCLVYSECNAYFTYQASV